MTSTSRPTALVVADRLVEELWGAYDTIKSFYFVDLMRDLAAQVRASDLEIARAEGTRLSFDDTIAIIRRTIDEEQTRLRNHQADPLPARSDAHTVVGDE